jgi:hypothetical protein
MTPPRLRAILLLALVSACAPNQQGPEPKDAKDVQLVKTEPPSTCQEVGSLVGEAPNGPGAEGKAKTNLREKAAQIGANYVLWETFEISEDPPRTTIHGTAYLCPATGGSPAESTPPAASTPPVAR